ncbi:MAG: 3D domain-containing protein [Candidatus Scalindua sp.]|nr:3D domain-containing protein [Candidatus Scalindua sp.]
MELRNNILVRLTVAAFFLVVLQTGCSTTVKTPSLSPAESKISQPEILDTVKEETLTQEVPKISQPEISDTVKKPARSQRVAGTGLLEIFDPNQFPEFKDDYGKIMLLYAIDNSRMYFEKIKSYPGLFKSAGFTPEKQLETLVFFRDGYLRCKNSQELNEFITRNFRIFQVVGKESDGEVHFTGYGTPLDDASVTEKWTYAVSHGSLGATLASIRSIATKKGLFPPGGLAFAVIETGKQNGDNQAQGKGVVGKSFFVLDQDPRSDINIANRADLFFGVGENAINEAESLNASGKLYYLLKK